MRRRARLKFEEHAPMNFRIETRLLLLSCALAASACSSSSATPSGGSGTPDGSAGNSPPTDGGLLDAPRAVPFDAAGLLGDASIANGGGDAAGYGDGGSFDFGCGGHGDCPLSQVCCTSPGPPITFSCVDPTTCPGPDKIECDGPDECSTTAPVCCGVAVGNGTGTFPACGAQTLGVSCAAAADCPTTIGTCSQTSTLQICHSHSDCTDTTEVCCSFGDGGAELSFCFDPTLAAAAGGVCH